MQATDKDVICDYAFDAINEIWNRIAKTVEREIKKITPHQTPKEEISLPEELNTEEAKNILQKAIDAGFCDANYQWKRTKALLAYFADKTSEYLKLGKGEYGGNLKTSWKPFESLFGVSGLAGAKRDWEKTGTLPQGYKDIDKLF